MMLLQRAESPMSILHIIEGRWPSSLFRGQADLPHPSPCSHSSPTHRNYRNADFSDQRRMWRNKPPDQASQHQFPPWQQPGSTKQNCLQKQLRGQHQTSSFWRDLTPAHQQPEKSSFLPSFTFSFNVSSYRFLSWVLPLPEDLIQTAKRQPPELHWEIRQHVAWEKEGDQRQYLEWHRILISQPDSRHLPHVWLQRAMLSDRRR